MKGDFTRSTFNPKKHYNSVRMQQGRLQLDADWNEQVDILAHLNQAQIRDLIGLSGVPNSDNNAQSFEISSIPGERDFTIASGRIYVDGILCELEKETKYTEQPDYPNALREDLKQEDLPEGEYIAYLDVWQRHITSVDDPQIREAALGNVPDTATRTKIVCQVKLLKLNNINVINVEEELAKFLQSAKQEWNNFLKQQQDRKIALNPKVSDDANLDNHLYRVEIHEGGEAGKATFKWSRDNGFVVSAIEKIDGNIITISQNNDEAWQLARPRQWVEIIRSDSTKNWELAGKPGILARLQRVSGNKLIIDPASIKNPRELILPDKFDREDKPGASFYKIRLWDYTIDTGEKAGIPIPSDDTEYIPLEKGIEIKFSGSGNYQTGDYWLIPTRKNSLNPLDWPTNGNDSSPYQQLPPNGIEHHYSCLATIVLTDQQELKIQDCRKPFISLVDYLDRLKGLNPEDFRTDRLQVKGQPENKAQGEISNITDLSLRYAGQGFEELSVGDTIIVKEPTPNNDKQVRSIQTIDQVAQILTINEPFESPLDNQEFSYQKPLALFSDNSGENKLTLNSLGLDFKGKIKTTELEIPGTFEVETFRVNGLEIGIRQNQDSFLNYGLIQAEEVGSNKQISFTAENEVNFAFLVKQGDGTTLQPLVVNDRRLTVNGIVDATDFFLDGTQWILDTERIRDRAVITSKLVDDAVTGDKLSPNAVDTNHISARAIATSKLADDAVTSEKLSDHVSDDLQRAVTTDHIRDRAVTTSKLEDNAVSAEKLRADDSNDLQRAVTTDHIRDGAVTLAKLDSSIIPNFRKWSDGDNGSIYYDNGNVALGTDQATAGLQVQGSEPETALGTISSSDLVTVTGNGTTFVNRQQGSLLIAANEIKRITQVLSTTEVTIDLPFSESLSGETFAVVPVQDITISSSPFFSQTTININGDMLAELSENNIIIAAGQIRTVLTLTQSSNEFTIDIPFKEPLQDSTPFAILQPEANITVSGWDEQTRSWNRAIARVEGELPGNLVARDDFIIADGQLRKVEKIEDTNSSFTVTPPFREPLPSNTNLFILSKESGTITAEITVTVDTDAAVRQLHVGDLIGSAGETRMITEISLTEKKLTIPAPFDSSLTNADFSLQQPIARFVDSNQQTQLIINAKGNVGIGTSIPTAKLQVDGPVRINDDLWCKGTLLQSSSLNLKTNIVELSRQEANQILRELNPIKFHYKEDRFNHPHIGFIAEDVPDLVASSDKKAICPVDIVAVLTKTVQNHEQTISQLTNLVDEQKHEIAILQENFTRFSELLQKKESRKKQKRLTIRAFWRQIKRLYSKTFRLVVLERDRK